MNFYMGYYDLAPISQNGHALVLSWSRVDPLCVSLNEWDILNNSVTCVADDVPFSWQLGNRQSYIKDGSYVAFHKRNTNKIIGVIKNLSTLQEVQIDAFYSISQNGEYVPWDWERYVKFRGSYGFTSSVKTSKPDIKELYDQEITIKSSNNGESRNLLNYRDLKDLLSSKDEYLIDHVQLSKDGRSLAFIAKPFNQPPGAESKFLIWRNSIGWHVVDKINQVSHYNFDEHGKLIVFGELKKRISRDSRLVKTAYKLVRPIWQRYNNDNRLTRKVFTQMYFMIDEINMVHQVDELPQGFDGHPSMTSEYLVTDTYPTDDGQVTLLFYELNKDRAGSLKKLNFSYDKNFLNTYDRVDLHPKISATNNIICVDRLENGKRFVTALSTND